MLSLFSIVGIVILIGVLPTFLGIFIRVFYNRSLQNDYIFNNLSLGIIFALFIDYMISSSQLGINLGPSIYSLTLLLCFIFGFMLIFFLSHYKFLELHFLKILLISITLSFHGFAEGIIIGYDLNNLGFYLSDARNIQTFSFVIHKFAEGFIIPFMYPISFSWIIISTLIVSFPIVLGSSFTIIGIPGIISSVFFSISSGALLFILIDFIKTDKLISFTKLNEIMFILLGFVLIYMAGLLHSI